MAIVHRSKTSTEQYPLTLDYTGQLPTGVTLSTATITATKRSDGTSDTSIVESTTPTPASTTVTIQFKAGTSGEKYLVKVAMTTSDGFTKPEAYIILTVEDVPT